MLIPIDSEAKRRVFDVPSELNGVSLKLGSPTDLAENGLRYLKTMRDELNSLLRS